MSILSDLSAFSNPFGAPSQNEWNLSVAQYTTKITGQAITFFYAVKDKDPSQKTAIDTITDGGGRRIAVYEYPYRDGQALADLGRKGETYTFNIKFFGANYQALFNKFIDVVVNNSEGGTLVHPIRSTTSGIPVRFVDYEFVHRYDEWNSVTIKATFREDNTDALALHNTLTQSSDSALRQALQAITSAQSFIGSAIFEVGALLLLPSAIQNAMEQRLSSITGAASALLGKLAATFSSDAALHNVATQSNTVGSVTNLTSGTVLSTTTGSSQSANLPPVYQVGFDITTETAIQAQISSFINANQITPQQAVYAANQSRASITVAITEVQTNFGNEGYQIELTYRDLANYIQAAVEAAIAAAQGLVTTYTVPYPMSLRMIAQLNKLSPDDGNAIEALNPYLQSVNLIAAGTVLTVPAA